MGGMLVHRTHLHHLGIHRTPLRTGTAGARRPQGDRPRLCRGAGSSGVIASLLLAVLPAPRSTAQAPARGGAGRRGTTLGADPASRADQARLSHRRAALLLPERVGRRRGLLGGALPEGRRPDQGASRGLATLTVEWVPVEADDRFSGLQQGKVDLLCGADTETLARRASVDFSIPIFPGGIGALLRADAARGSRRSSRDRPHQRPNWRAHGGPAAARPSASSWWRAPPPRPGWPAGTGVPAHREDHAGGDVRRRRSR